MVFILDSLLAWSLLEFVAACIAVVLGTILGHDAALAVLEFRATAGAKLDHWMVVLFPSSIGLAVLAGYCSLGFAAGSYRFLLTLIG